ncbi:hypothetical protein D3C73_1459660 [compost metagenome]
MEGCCTKGRNDCHTDKLTKRVCQNRANDYAQYQHGDGARKILPANIRTGEAHCFQYGDRIAVFRHQHFHKQHRDQ